MPTLIRQHRPILTRLLIVGTLLGLGLALSTSCRSEDEGRFSGPFPVENFANAALPESEEAEGQFYFLNETWDAETGNSWPPYWFVQQTLNEELDVFGDQFVNFGTLFDPNKALPVGLVRGSKDRQRIHETCAFCHTAALPTGERWLGAPNANLQLGALKIALNDRWVGAGYASLFSPLQEEKMLTLGAGRIDASSASYPRAVPADFPPYFRLGEKTALNHLGTGGDLRSEVAMALYAFGAGAPANDDQIPITFPADAKVEAFVRFLGTIDPPRTEERPSNARLDRGARLFEETGCIQCHLQGDIAALGVTTHVASGRELLPGVDDAFPNGTIATSIAHRTLIDGDDGSSASDDDTGQESASDDDQQSGGVDSGRLALIAFIIGGGYNIGPTDGYRVPDLGGVWATAPYLHNGSVPTLEDLLTPPAGRPVSFQRPGSMFETSTWGNDNGGHAFGTGLTQADKDALIAFLRSL